MLRKVSALVAVGISLLASTSCTTTGATGAPAGATSAPAPGSAPSTWSKRPDARAADLVSAGLLLSTDVGGSWTVLREGTGPVGPEPVARPATCPFTNDVLEGVVLVATSAEYQNGDMRISEGVMVFESEDAARAAMEVRQRERDEECKKDALVASLAARGPALPDGTPIVTQEVIDGPGYADEELYTALGLRYRGPTGSSGGGVLYSSSRVGRVLVLVEASSSFEPIREMPPFVKAPLDRLRAAGAG